MQPASSGIGGGGFALVWDAAQRKVTALDFAKWPRGLDPAALEYRPKELIQSGRGRMIGVPGEVAGLAELHRVSGAARSPKTRRRPSRWPSRATPPATIWRASPSPTTPRSTTRRRIKRLFKPDGYAVGVGRRIVNRDLGATLRRIGAEGPKAFYEGEVAAEIVKAAQATGSSISLRDLRAYRPVEREPLKIAWEGTRSSPCLPLGGRPSVG